MTDEPILETINLVKTFSTRGAGAVPAVQGVNLAVRRGDIFGFLGPNGAGKTTTIGMILGLIYPSAGQVRLFGQPVTPTRQAILHRVGALVGAPALAPYLSARENLALMARMHPEQPAKRIDEVLAWIGLQETGSRPAGKFSTGMKQRLGLGLALFGQPELLILDEPTNGMDPAGMREVRQLLAMLAGSGTTVFLSSHLLHEIEQICSQVAVLSRGKVVAQGPVNSLLGSGRGQAHVKVRSDQPQRAAQALAQLPGASLIATHGDCLTVSGVPSQEVIRFLVHHDLPPSEVTIVKPDLESLFLELTQN